ncbi:hypothetical protein WBP_0999 [Wolbachia endosymbiont of Brugia pahangi]|nr:hypothetical protein WBP_0999 [Wolbachia endosymbiont of Brugia pahangi]
MQQVTVKKAESLVEKHKAISGYQTLVEISYIHVYLLIMTRYM